MDMKNEKNEKKYVRIIKTFREDCMENFVQYTPTRVVFGRGTENKTGELVKMYGGSRVFIVYGGSSAVKSGLIDRIKESLRREGIEFDEQGGTKPNPVLTHAEEGVRRAEDFGADFILGVGGGSAIDTAKAIAHGCANPYSKLWDIWTKKVPLEKSLPVGAVLTIAAAGSEMSDSAVLTNEALGIKAGINTEFNRCKFAVMNPELLFTLPKYQLAAGITDIMMHTMERYFIPDIKCDLTDEIAEGLLRTVIKNGRAVMAQEDNYDAMAEIMWCSSLSHNNLTECGRGKDFSVHKFGHALSAKYDYTHGATLSAVWGSWAEYLYMDALPRFSQFARRVYGVKTPDDRKAAKEGIERTVAFFREIGMPTSIIELGCAPTEKELKELAMAATKQDTLKLTRIHPVGAKEAEEIFRRAVAAAPSV